MHGDKHLDVAGAIEMLGWNLRARNQRAEAEALFRESLALRRKLMGARHYEVTFPLNSLAIMLSEHPSTIADAEALARESLAIRRQSLPEHHPHLAEPLGILGSILRERGKTEPGKSAEAEVAIRETVAIHKKHLGPVNENLPDLLNVLAANLCDQVNSPKRKRQSAKPCPFKQR